MRYRPFGQAGMPVSSIALTVDDRAGERGADALAGLIIAALEAGVNTFHIESCEPEVLHAVGGALAAVERRLVFVSLRLGLHSGRTGPVRDFSRPALTGAIDQALAHTGLGHLDLVLLDAPGEDELTFTALTALKHERTTGRVGLLGVAGGYDAMDGYLETGDFDVLASPYHPRSGRGELNRVRTAGRMEMGVIAYDYFPELFRQKSTTPGVPQKQERGLFVRGPELHPLAGAGTFAFLHDTRNWTAEELCLAYALMEPSVSTVLVRADALEPLAALASVPDRDLPPGLAAKVEMARFHMDHAAVASGLGGAIDVVDAYAAPRPKVADAFAELRGLEAPKVEAPEDEPPAVEPPKVEGRKARALSHANWALYFSSLWAKTATPALPPVEAPLALPPPAAQPSAVQPQTATAPNASSSVERVETPDIQPVEATPEPPPAAAELSVAQPQTATPPDASSNVAPDIPPVEATPDLQATAAEPSAAEPQTAIWRSKDYDYHVKPTGESFPGPDGRMYLKVDFNGSLTFVPAYEVEFPEGMAPREPEPEPVSEVLQARMAKFAR